MVGLYEEPEKPANAIECVQHHHPPTGNAFAPRLGPMWGAALLSLSPSQHAHVATFFRSFIKMTLGAPSGVDVDALKAENEQLKIKCSELEQELASAKAALEPAAEA